MFPGASNTEKYPEPMETPVCIKLPPNSLVGTLASSSQSSLKHIPNKRELETINRSAPTANYVFIAWFSSLCGAVKRAVQCWIVKDFCLPSDFIVRFHPGLIMFSLSSCAFRSPVFWVINFRVVSKLRAGWLVENGFGSFLMVSH